MRRIRDCIKELKERRDWKSIEEVNAVFDKVEKLTYEIEKEHNLARYNQGNTLVELRAKIARLEKRGEKK